MEDVVFKILKTKKDFTDQDIQMLIILCEKLFKRNEEISIELGKAFEQVDRLTKRLGFYRNVTMKEIK